MSELESYSRGTGMRASILRVLGLGLSPPIGRANSGMVQTNLFAASVPSMEAKPGSRPIGERYPRTPRPGNAQSRRPRRVPRPARQPGAQTGPDGPHKGQPEPNRATRGQPAGPFDQRLHNICWSISSMECGEIPGCPNPGNSGEHTKGRSSPIAFPSRRWSYSKLQDS
jgi:hypothetical protein